MKIRDIQKILDAENLTGGTVMETEITAVISSDLMSDVLTFSKSNSLLLTGLTNPQTIRTAEMSEIACVCFVRGKHPQKETVELAVQNRIPLLSTEISMYEACGRLYAAGFRNCDSHER